MFCGEDNLPQLKTTLEKYFPLLPFATGIIPERVEGETSSADELLGEVPKENYLLEEKTVNQSGPEGENPNEKVAEGETLGDGDKGGEFPNDFDEEKPNETSEIIVPHHKDGDTPTVKVTESKEPLVLAAKPGVQETVHTKPAVEDTVATKPVVQETIATKPAIQEAISTKPALQETIATKSAVQETIATKPAVQETVYPPNLWYKRP